jgi:hypothetical protein
MRHARLLLALSFDPEDEGDLFLGNFGRSERTSRRCIVGDGTIRKYSTHTEYRAE